MDFPVKVTVRRLPVSVTREVFEGLLAQLEDACPVPAATAKIFMDALKDEYLNRKGGTMQRFLQDGNVPMVQRQTLKVAC